MRSICDKLPIESQVDGGIGQHCFEARVLGNAQKKVKCAVVSTESDVGIGGWQDVLVVQNEAMPLLKQRELTFYITGLIDLLEHGKPDAFDWGVMKLALFLASLEQGKMIIDLALGDRIIRQKSHGRHANVDLDFVGVSRISVFGKRAMSAISDLIDH